jgi:hypothetical protein
MIANPANVLELLILRAAGTPALCTIIKGGNHGGMA